MDKKDIYEHLARIYLDASSKKGKKSGKLPQVSKQIFVVVSAFILGAGLIFFTHSRRVRPFNSQVALVLLPEASKLNFNFDPAKKESYTIDLKHLNVDRYNTLGFAVKKINYREPVALRIEFVNNYKEKSEVYVRDLESRWQDHTISLSDFKGISDWSDMSSVAFIVEEWNTRTKKGIVYIDNVRLIK